MKSRRAVFQHGSLCILLIFALSVCYLIMINVIFTNVEVGGITTLDGRTRFISAHSKYFSNQGSKPAVKLILLWNQLFHDNPFLDPQPEPFKNCTVSNCNITTDRRLLLESDAVIFHIRNLSMLDIPRIRSPKQKWIFFSLEAPAYSKFQGFGFMHNMFNWTMTYRKDSDVVIPYGRVVGRSIPTADGSDFYSRWSRKTRLAVWMVSHCTTEGNRERYVRQMQNYMDIDVFGSCGYASCPFNKTRSCLENFSEKYHFFLAFENSVCDGYITEKLFRTLKYDMIPVVFGGGNYSATAPPHSYIDAMDFPSPKQLSRFLLRVASNYTTFSGYFQWRAGSVSENTADVCQLCRKLHSPTFEVTSVYPDINEWWVKNSNCRRWNGKTFVKI